MQQFLKPARGPARARVVPAELLEQLLVSAHDPAASLHARFGRISLPALTRDLETGTGLRVWSSSWHDSFDCAQRRRAFFTCSKTTSTKFLLTTKKHARTLRALLHMNMHTQRLCFEDAGPETRIA